jgi:MurNAc alpha-1-phosphate uridylyltransferase
MVLAAGLGTRMRPLTEELPKPMLPLAGRTLLDHALDRLAEAGVTQAVVNAHWRPDAIDRAIAARAEPPRAIVVREEGERLETGGGVRNALPHLGGGPFVVANGDAFWLNGPMPALARMAAAFDPERMDALLLLVRTAQVEGSVGHGDFLLDPLGRVRRRREREIAPYLFGGVQILTPRFFEGSPEGPFSLNLLYDRAIEAERLYALVHDGAWFHLSTPADLRHAEEQLRRGLAKALF